MYALGPASSGLATGALQEPDVAADGAQGFLEVVRGHVGELLQVEVGALEVLGGLAQGGLGALALHGDGHLVGYGSHEVKLRPVEAGAGASAEGEGAEHAPLRDQRKGGVGLDAEGPDQRGARIVRLLDVLGHDALGVAGGAPADGDRRSRATRCAGRPRGECRRRH